MDDERERLLASKRQQVRELVGDVCGRLNLAGTHNRIIQVLDLSEAISARRLAGQPVPMRMRVEIVARQLATGIEMIAMLLALPVIILARMMR